ncbi:hypothetical protein ACH0B6_08530 [Solibacillus silvestris]
MKKYITVFLSVLIFLSAFQFTDRAHANEMTNVETEQYIINDDIMLQDEYPVELMRKDGDDAFELGYIIAHGLFNSSTHSWHPGSFGFAAESIVYHYDVHGAEVGAKSAADYLNKAIEYRKTAKKGVKPSNVRGEVDGVKRYRKNGKYIDLAPDGRIVSFGRT